MSESKYQQACLRYLRAQGIYHINIHGAGWTARGCPDIVVCLNGRFVAVELKIGDNEMSPAQHIHRQRILENGGRHVCPRSLEEFIQTIQEIKEEFTVQKKEG
ncbi:MAG: hypothetical protein DDT19_02192 [Syntrophomonadaceae bacterium]|nr:hypothetical protein [Bacillota bacterium]